MVATLPTRSLSAASDVQIIELWSQVIRNHRPEHVTHLLRKRVAPSGHQESKLVEVGQEMTKRNLFETRALV